MYTYICTYVHMLKSTHACYLSTHACYFSETLWLNEIKLTHGQENIQSFSLVFSANHSLEKANFVQTQKKNVLLKCNSEVIKTVSAAAGSQHPLCILRDIGATLIFVCVMSIPCANQHWKDHNLSYMRAVFPRACVIHACVIL